MEHKDKQDNIQNSTDNPLGVMPVGRLLTRFAVPSIIAMLVSALYNIVDQFFIGRSVGNLGNAATNIAFPLSITCIAISLLFGIGGASAFNLSIGAGDKKTAAYYIGNSAAMLFILGTLLCIFTQLFMTPLLKFFGSPSDVMGYAVTYTRITSTGFPFLIFATGGGHLIRADGSPVMTMACNMAGAVINTVLDAAFIFGFKMGMAGAALATITGQAVSALIAVIYFFHYKTVNLETRHLKPQIKYISKIVSLGASPFSNQMAMMVVQIVMNKSLKHYGSLSVYGESIPIACVGIITKTNQVFFSFLIGISQGLQPIASFNYGAKKYTRVKKVYLRAISCGAVLSVIAFIIFQVFPQNIIAAFGDGSEEYFRFATNYFRIFLFFTFINFMQPVTSNFFTAIGKPKRGIFLSLTRQIIFLLPLLLLLPFIMGIDGIMYAGPVADCMAGIASFILVAAELKNPEYKDT